MDLIILIVSVIISCLALLYAILLFLLPVVVYMIYTKVCDMERTAYKSMVILDEVAGYFRNAVDKANK